MLIFEPRLNTETNEPTMVFDGLAVDGETQAVNLKYAWRWLDEPTMEFQFLGEAVPGGRLDVPFDLGGRSILVAQVSYDDLGRGSETNWKQAKYVILEPPTAPSADEGEFEAYEDLDAGDILSIIEDSGIQKVRKADARFGYPAHCFCVDNAVGSSFFGGDTVRVFFIGNEHAIGLSGLNPGERLYLSDTAGEMTTTPPSGSGYLVQMLGTAKSPTSMIFQPEEPIVLR